MSRSSSGSASTCSSSRWFSWSAVRWPANGWASSRSSAISWFWFGSQGYEYVDLGRFWQILLFVGLVLWLRADGARAQARARRARAKTGPLLTLFLISSIAIPLFYAAGLMYGQRSHLVTAEYWRWWVVHLWVEGFFEVFATVVIAFLFTRLKLLEIRTATTRPCCSRPSSSFPAASSAPSITCTSPAHDPRSSRLGAIFSALEVVPLTLIGFEAWENLRLARPTEKSPWIANYKWPIYFFVAVAFWNLVGAGLFGFLINPPIALYYMQGLNLTPVHGHTALFGVYGMLGLGLTLFCLRVLQPGRPWKEGVAEGSPSGSSMSAWSSWSCSACCPSACCRPGPPSSAARGMRARRSSCRPAPMQTLRWMRVPGDILFALGAALLGWFVLGLLTGHSYEKPTAQTFAKQQEEEREAVLTH